MADSLKLTKAYLFITLSEECLSPEGERGGGWMHPSTPLPTALSEAGSVFPNGL